MSEFPGAQDASFVVHLTRLEHPYKFHPADDWNESPHSTGNVPVAGWKKLRSGLELTTRSSLAQYPQSVGNPSAVGWKRTYHNTYVSSSLEASKGFNLLYSVCLLEHYYMHQT